MPQYLIIGLIFFASYAISTVSGFGGAVLGLPLLALVVGITAAKQSMVLLGILLYAIMTFRSRDQIDRRELKRILVLASPGLLIGMLACHYLPAHISIALLGLFILIISLRGLLSNHSPHAGPPGWASRALLFLGGLVHGAFTTGGPLVVIYCQRALPARPAFRATLGAMWVLMGGALVLQWTLTHSWDAHATHVSLLGLPFLLAGMLGGELLNDRVDARTFTTGVHLILLITGTLLLWSALR